MSSGDFKLHLIVRASGSEPGACFQVEGTQWTVSEVVEITNVPAYTCISYIWGDETEREGNPFYPALGPEKISTHTLSSLTSAIKAFQSETPAFWIDAFCIPTYDPSRPETREEKNATLESMGYIYHKATKVAVVLVNESYTAISYMLENMNRVKVSSSVQSVNSSSVTFTPTLGMDCLECDRWISSVWTYQEVMGNMYLYFLSESVGDPPLGFEKCFNAIGQFSSEHFDTLEKYPRLDAFLTLGGDWMMSSNTYALKVMANMDNRYTGEAKNYWYARIGAMTTERTTRATKAEDKELSQKFMDLCEGLGDFSFIFAAAERESEQDGRENGTPWRRWRPRAGKLPAVLPEHNTGNPQKGKLQEDGTLELYDIVIYPVGPQVLTQENIRWLVTLKKNSQFYLKSTDLSPTKLNTHNITNECFRILQTLGFKGSPDCIIVEDGFFFPQWSDPSKGSGSVLVSASITYSIGAPSLLMNVDDQGNPSYMPGIFMGQVPTSRKRDESVTLR
ncbi:hypothetical protein CPB86DRAFT_873785 [Serendipita vermifera]|nr:hypothetical protein CPB86DRAFT_873785 [Serendipita vermifera]